MILHVLRALFILLMGAVGYFLLLQPQQVFGAYTWLTLGIVLSIGVLIVCVDILSPRRKLAVFSGTFLGLLVGVFAYAESPLLQALWADATRGAPQQAAFGAYFAISYGAGSAWIAILGWTIDHLGFTASFWVMGGSFVVATAVLMLAPSRMSAATTARA